MKKQLNFVVDEEIINKLDGYAKSLNISRNSAFCVMVNQYFQNSQNMDTLKQFMTLYELEKNNIMKGEVI